MLYGIQLGKKIKRHQNSPISTMLSCTNRRALVTEEAKPRAADNQITGYPLSSFGWRYQRLLAGSGWKDSTVWSNSNVASPVASFMDTSLAIGK